MAGADDPDDRQTRGGHGRDRQGHIVRAGSLLVSSTALVEPTFRRTVIYIIEHNDAGSLGVVINRPSSTAVHDVLPPWNDLAVGPRTLFHGGPVKQDAALCLGLLRVGAELTDRTDIRRVDGRMVLIGLGADPATISPLVEGVRIFLGYAGWTFGQLESELDNGDWLVLSALPGDPLISRRGDLWADVLRRQPLPLSLLATHPIELERN